MSDYLKAINERVVIYDGAMGTAVKAYNLTLDEFWGKDGYNDILVLSRPDIVKEIHSKYFTAGADVVETNTLSSTPLRAPASPPRGSPREPGRPCRIRP